MHRPPSQPRSAAPLQAYVLPQTRVTHPLTLAALVQPCLPQPAPTERDVEFILQESNRVLNRRVSVSHLAHYGEWDGDVLQRWPSLRRCAGHAS